MSSPEIEPPKLSPGSPASQLLGTIVREGRVQVEPHVLEALAQDFQELADAMADYAETARRDLYVDKLGFGEEHLSNSADLLRKFQDKAVGGGLIAKSSSMAGQFDQHREYALEMKSVVVYAQQVYARQDEATATDLGNVGGDL